MVSLTAKNLVFALIVSSEFAAGFSADKNSNSNQNQNHPAGKSTDEAIGNDKTFKVAPQAYSGETHGTPDEHFKAQEHYKASDSVPARPEEDSNSKNSKTKKGPVRDDYDPNRMGVDADGSNVKDKKHNEDEAQQKADGIKSSNGEPKMSETAVADEHELLESEAQALGKSMASSAAKSDSKTSPDTEDSKEEIIEEENVHGRSSSNAKAAQNEIPQEQSVEKDPQEAVPDDMDPAFGHDSQAEIAKEDAVHGDGTTHHKTNQSSKKPEKPITEEEDPLRESVPEGVDPTFGVDDEGDITQEDTAHGSQNVQKDTQKQTSKHQNAVEDPEEAMKESVPDDMDPTFGRDSEEAIEKEDAVHGDGHQTKKPKHTKNKADIKPQDPEKAMKESVPDDMDPTFGRDSEQEIKKEDAVHGSGSGSGSDHSGQSTKHSSKKQEANSQAHAQEEAQEVQEESVPEDMDPTFGHDSEEDINKENAVHGKGDHKPKHTKQAPKKDSKPQDPKKAMKESTPEDMDPTFGHDSKQDIKEEDATFGHGNSKKNTNQQGSDSAAHGYDSSDDVRNQAKEEISKAMADSHNDYDGEIPGNANADHEAQAVADERQKFEETHKSSFSRFVGSAAMIVVSEIGDKTFFIAALMAMRHAPAYVFTSSYSAMVVMTVLSMVIGYILPSLLSKKVTTLLASVLFLVFGIRLMNEGLKMDKRLRATEELKDVEDEIALKDSTKSALTAEAGGFKPSRYGRYKRGNKFSRIINRFEVFCASVWVQIFAMTFLGEWGDRSQIATVAMGTGSSWASVLSGCLFGHFITTVIAVLGGHLLAQHLSLRSITISGALCFLVFAFLYFRDWLNQ